VTSDIAGQWAASVYGLRGTRRDVRLSLNRDGSYRRVCRSGHDEVEERGRWHLREEDTILRFEPEPGGAQEQATDWAVLSVTTCEDSNLLLVLRRVAIASTNLPVLYYRTDWSGGSAAG
jgi:hypothetical protein